MFLFGNDVGRGGVDLCSRINFTMYQQLDTGDTDGGDAAPDDAQSASAPSSALIGNGVSTAAVAP